MARDDKNLIVALDIGTRRIGVALSDSGGTVATPYEVVTRSGDRARDHRRIGGLVEEAGTERETGAILYGTTDLLLTNLGINSIDELPHVSPLLDDGQGGFDLD